MYKIIIILLTLFFSISFIYAQSLNENLNEYYCTFGKIETNDIIKNEFTDEILKNLIIINLRQIKINSILMLFEENYQIFIFRLSNCTNQFLYDEIAELYLNNRLHLFSIEGKFEPNPNIIKLVIQTKKEFQIFYYNNDTRINTNSEQDLAFNIKTNLFHYFKNKFFYNEEFQIYRDGNINIFNEDGNIFNDICYKYEAIYITKPPELRKSLYYYKNSNSTYPLLPSKDNCIINKTSISYEIENIILEYTCKVNLTFSPKNININGISLINKENIEKYDGTNSLEDQKELLKCYKESFNSKNLKNNIGFYVSLVLIIVVFICLIILIVQKYEIKQEEDSLIEAPPKKKSLKETLKEKKENKKMNFKNVELISDDNKINKKKIKKKKKKINNNDNEEKNKHFNNMIESNEEKEFDDSQKEELNKAYKEKSKKKKKKGKTKKGRKINNEKIENNEIKKSYDNKNEQDSDFNYGNEEIDVKFKTVSKFPSAYKKFQINSGNRLKEQLNLRRLIIITNLGNNIKNSEIFNNINTFKNTVIIKNDSDSNATNLKNNNNEIIPIPNNKIENEEDNKKEKLGILLGLENNTFSSNIMRDYLDIKNAKYFDRRKFCHIFSHFMKLKNDFINIFNCNYSLTPYTIRMIKFAFFFHFMFYLEIFCIGQKYYFQKYYSKEFQEFIVDNYFEGDYNLYISNNNKYSINYNKNYNIKEINKIHFLYTYKFAFPRVLIPAAISLISYIFSSILSPRRKIMKIILNTSFHINNKHFRINRITHKYKIIYICFAILALIIMIFFFYSITNYFFVFDDAKYDITQSFILSGLIRFIFDTLLWTIISKLRVHSIKIYNEKYYNIINKIYEIN